MFKDTEITAKIITEKVAKSSFKLYRSRKFRILSHIDNMDQVEKDRIFNEIVISGISLAILIFEDIADHSKKQNKEQYFRQLSLELNNRYGNWLMEISAQQEHAQLFKKVIKMRTDEYRGYFKKYKKELSNSHKTSNWIPIVTTGSFFHITRGKPKDDSQNHYFLMFRDFMNHLSIMIMKSVL